MFCLSYFRKYESTFESTFESIESIILSKVLSKVLSYESTKVVVLRKKEFTVLHVTCSHVRVHIVVHVPSKVLSRYNVTRTVRVQ